MTARHTHHRTQHRTDHRSTHHGGEFRRPSRLLALAQLTLAVGAPLVLLVLLCPNPLDVPEALRSRQALTNPVDDVSLLWLLTTLSWLAYTHFLCCLLAETYRQLRGSTRRLPGERLLFGANATLACHLVAGLLLTASSSSLTSALPMTHLAVAAVTAPLTGPDLGPPSLFPATHPAAHAPHASAPADAAKADQALPRCRVLPPDGRDHDTLWDIAERHLGDGMRWREIYQLNDGKLMPDGQRLTRASLIHPGWILTLPADARHLNLDHVLTSTVPDTATTSTPAPTRTETRTQPSTHADRSPQTLTTSSGASALTEPGSAAPTTDTRPASPGQPVRPEGAVRPGVDGQTASLPPEGGTATAPSAAATADPARSPGASENDPTVVVQVAEVLGLAALATLTALTRRRKVATRRRPQGARTALPAPELLAEERRLRQAARLAEDTAATVRLALLLATTHAPTAQLKTVWQHRDGSLELCWSEHPSLLEAPAPFATTDRGWLLPAGSHRLLFATRHSTRHAGAGKSTGEVDRTTRLDRALDGRSDAVPLLVPVGNRPDGSTCLVNLEVFGLLSLTSQPGHTRDHDTSRTAAAAPSGSAHQDSDKADHDNERTPAAEALIEQVLGRWVQALAGAPWADAVRCVLPDDLADCATGLHRIRLDHHPRWTHLDLDDEALAVLRETGSFSAARRRSAAVDEHLSELYAGHRPDQLDDALLRAATDPTQPVTVLLRGMHPDAHSWTLTGQGLLQIPGIADDLTPLRVDPTSQRLRLRLLEHAQDPPILPPDNPHRNQLREQCPPQPDNDSGTDTDTADTGDTADSDATAEASGIGDPSFHPTSGSSVAPAEPPAAADAVPDDAAQRPSSPAAGQVIDLTEIDSSTASLSLGANTVEQVAPVEAASLGNVGAAGQPAAEEHASETEAPPVPATMDDSTAISPSPVRKAGRPRASDDPDPTFNGPMEVGILGPLQLQGPDRPLPYAPSLQLLVYMAFHRRPMTAVQLWEGVWPNDPIQPSTNRTRRSELKIYLSPLLRTVGQRYVLDDLVKTDWQRFQTLADGNPSQQQAALLLVRGLPFTGVDGDWIHLEGQFHEIEASVVDLALTVGQRALSQGEYDVARTAAAAGLRAAPFEERLYQVALRSAAARNATAELRTLRKQLALALEDEIEPDDSQQPATIELLQEIDLEQARRDYLQRRRPSAT